MNRQKVLAKAKAYRDTHKDQIREYRQRPESKERARIAKRSEKYKQKDRIRRQRPENKAKALAYKRTQKYKAYSKKYKQRPEVKARSKELRLERIKSDPLYVIKTRTRNLIKESIRKGGYSKNTKTRDILGCDFEYLFAYLSATWKSNYGTEWNGEDYHIDHIIPLATAKSEEDVIELCHYTNLQMLTPEDNLSKGTNIYTNFF